VIANSDLKFQEMSDLEETIENKEKNEKPWQKNS